MNIFKKLIFQACFIGCLIPGASIIASQPETNISIVCPEEVQYLATINELAIAQVDQMEANLQHISELLTSKKLKTIDAKEMRSKLTQIIYFLENQKEITIQLTPEAIDRLILINKVCLEYFLVHIPNKIDAISREDLITKIQDFFAALNAGTQSVGSFDEILTENNAKLAKLSYACDTAGLSQINQLYRYLEQKNVFKNTQTTLMVGGATFSIAVIATYLYFQKKETTHTPGANGSIIENEIKKYAPELLLEVLPKRLSSITTPIANFTSKIITNAVEPFVNLSTSIGYPIITQTPVSVLPILAGTLAPFAKEIKDFSFNQYQKFNNYLRGETGAPKNTFKTNSAKKVYFKDLIGVQDLEQIAQEYIDYLKHPDRYDRSGTAPSKAILLVGPPQTGKSLFANALHTAIEEEFKDSDKPGFLNINRAILNQYSIEQIFAWAQYCAPCIIFIDEIDMLGADRNKNSDLTSQLLTCMSGLNAETNGKKVFVIAATNKPNELDEALIQHGRFGKIIPFEYPKFAERKAILDKLIYDKALDIQEDFIIQIAQETEGLSFNAITAIITEAMRIAKQATRLVKPADIDTAFDTAVRNISPYATAQDTIESKQAIAAYQAGKAAAYLLSNPQKKLAKVTTKRIIKKIEYTGNSVKIDNKGDNTPELKKNEAFTKDSYRLGDVFTYHEIDACPLQSSDDQEHDIMCLLAGRACQQMLIGKTYSKVCIEDIEQAKGMIHSLCADALLTKDEMLKRSHQLEEKFHAKIADILNNNKDLVEKLYKALLEKETLDRDTLKKFTA